MNKFVIPLVFLGLLLASCSKEEKGAVIADNKSTPAAIDKSQIGLAYSDGKKVGCIIYPNKNANPPKKVLINFRAHSGALIAEVGNKLRSCKSKELGDLNLEGDIYELKFISDVSLYDEVALPASDWGAIVSNGKINLKNKTSEASYLVDSCTSNEGLWTTLLQESGVSLKPLYSVYRPLGYATQPTCGQGGYEPIYQN